MVGPSVLDGGGDRQARRSAQPPLARRRRRRARSASAETPGNSEPLPSGFVRESSLDLLPSVQMINGDRRDLGGVPVEPMPGSRTGTRESIGRAPSRFRSAEVLDRSGPILQAADPRLGGPRAMPTATVVWPSIALPCCRMSAGRPLRLPPAHAHGQRQPDAMARHGVPAIEVGEHEGSRICVRHDHLRNQRTRRPAATTGSARRGRMPEPARAGRRARCAAGPVRSRAPRPSARDRAVASPGASGSIARS